MKRRRELRLKKYDYSSAGVYFVTIVTNFRKIMFGSVESNEVVLNLAGEMVQSELEILSTRFAGIKLGAFVVMPNHVHFNLEIEVPGINLGDVICAFKSVSKVRYIEGVNHENWPTFDKRLWQRGYYEHIIRDLTSLNQIIEYINNNPHRWPEDAENPDVER